MLDETLAAKLACPRDRSALRADGRWLECAEGHRYPVVEGVPVLLVDDAPSTLWVADASWRLACEAARTGVLADPLFRESLGISDDERRSLGALEQASRRAVDPVVQVMIAATSGILYRSLLGHLEDYPIPEIRLPPAHGEWLLDVGCNWGRWSVAAARKGYTAVGIDPSLGAVLAARRVARDLGVAMHGVVGDARYLPFRAASFHTVFSYSVLQHFRREDVRTTLAEVSRVLERPGGVAFVQLANALGARSAYHLARRGFGDGRGFEVRYWTPAEMVAAFEHIGPTEISVDGYFGLGIQPAEARFLPRRYRAVVRVSEALRRASEVMPWMTRVADSLYVRARAR